jgi:hypothetical protein
MALDAPIASALGEAPAMVWTDMHVASVMAEGAACPDDSCSIT